MIKIRSNYLTGVTGKVQWIKFYLSKYIVSYPLLLFPTIANKTLNTHNYTYKTETLSEIYNIDYLIYVMFNITFKIVDLYYQKDSCLIENINLEK